MKLLAVETATEACSAALLAEGEVIERHEVAPQQHAELLLGMVDELLGESGLALGALDAIAFGQGPGSFTGLRIAAGVVQGLAYGSDLPAVPVSTLQVLAETARHAHRAKRAACAFDARMGEVYWGLYEVGEGGEAVMLCLGEDVVTSPGDAPGALGGGWVAVGSAWLPYEDALIARLGQVEIIDDSLTPRAGHLATLGAYWFERGRHVSADEVRPVYLRNQVTRAPGGAHA